MAVIAFLQHRLGRTDGVSLEVDKWRRVLEGMGHTVHYIAGNEDVPGGHAIPELYPFHPVTERLIRNATRALTEYPDGTALMEEAAGHKAIVKRELERLLRALGVELLIPNNLQSVGYNLPGMLAVSEVLGETGLPAICHSHDFWWEDSGEVDPTCDEVLAVYREHAPPGHANVRHVVINRIGQRELKARRGLDARVVPNVFDFDQPAWSADDYNADFRAAIDVRPTDIVLLQATRILDRKAVELAIDFAARLQAPDLRAQLEAQPLYDGRRFGPDDRVVLVCAGYVEGIGLSADYHANLVAKAAAQNVEIRWAGDIVKHSRGQEGDRKIYSLWDSYVAADFVTYPSVWEGWGNQLIEALFARLPVMLFEYPVYVTDLKQVGLDVVSLGDTIVGRDTRGLVQVAPDVMERAAREAVVLLQDSARRRAVVDHNVAVARKHFSMQALAGHIEALFADAGIR